MLSERINDRIMDVRGKLIGEYERSIIVTP